MNIYGYIIAMSVTTYLLRMLPMTLFQKEIKNQFICSFLTYVPCASLTAMTFPAILSATNSVWSAAAGFLVALVFALWNKSLVTVAVSGCATVYVMEKLMAFL